MQSHKVVPQDLAAHNEQALLVKYSIWGYNGTQDSRLSIGGAKVPKLESHD